MNLDKLIECMTAGKTSLCMRDGNAFLAIGGEFFSVGRSSAPTSDPIVKELSHELVVRSGEKRRDSRIRELLAQDMPPVGTTKQNEPHFQEMGNKRRKCASEELNDCESSWKGEDEEEEEEVYEEDAVSNQEDYCSYSEHGTDSIEHSTAQDISGGHSDGQAARGECPLVEQKQALEAILTDMDVCHSEEIETSASAESSILTTAEGLENVPCTNQHNQEVLGESDCGERGQERNPDGGQSGDELQVDSCVLTAEEVQVMLSASGQPAFNKSVRRRDRRNRRPASSLVEEEGPKSNLPRFSCSDCDKVSFPTRISLRNHMDTVHAGKRYPCHQCSKGFENLRLLGRHRQDAAHMLQCSECPAKFKDTVGLLRHTSARHIGQTLDKDSNDPPAAESSMAECCWDCGSNDDGTLVLHSCEYCGMEIGCEHILQNHVLKHTSTKDFVCEHCGFLAGRRSTLESHVRNIHTREKPYACSMCEQVFTTSTARVDHERIVHTGEKPFVCDECGKAFHKCSALIDHKRTHSTAQQYACDLCSSRFKHPYTLVVHKRKHEHR